ncbi:TPA: hypothetical protein G8O00_000926 [Salmonella enterica]|uniref:Uncharacterized protein n=1 Tax=Salmonella enterica TaxID=28901 RepID=A0A747XG52_SALER|nr:hypothetical protein [Salmonella enterica]HAF4697570.1 hypothetical protein [Salmonella enterica]
MTNENDGKPVTKRPRRDSSEENYRYQRGRNDALRLLRSMESSAPEEIRLPDGNSWPWFFSLSRAGKSPDKARSEYFTSMPVSPDEQAEYLTYIIGMLSDRNKRKPVPKWLVGTIADRTFLSALVAVANQKKRNRNITVCENIFALPWVIRSVLPGGGAVLLRVKSSATHVACVYVYTDVSGRMSVLLFESAVASEISDKIEDIMCRGFDRKTLRIMVFAMDIQRSQGECAMFALHTAQCLCDNHRLIAEFHSMMWNSVREDGFKKNCSQRWNDDRISVIFSAEECDRLCPPCLYKHTQSRTRLSQYTDRSGNGNHQVNKKNETLTQRQARLTVTEKHDRVPRVISIDNMRIKKYRELIFYMVQMYADRMKNAD